MRRHKIVLIGNGTLAARGLEALAGVADIPLVIADALDDGVDSWRESLVKRAQAMGYDLKKTLLQPRNPNGSEVTDKIKDVNPDIILSLQCRHIIRRNLFSIPPMGTFNLHNAPLPLLRGCDPFSWAIHDGLKQMGVTLHRIPDEGIDNGPVLVQRTWPVDEDTSAWDLYTKGLDMGVEMLIEAFTADKLPQEAPQKEEWCTYHPMGQFDFSDTQVKWNTIADTLSAWIRSRIFPPIQLPWFVYNKAFSAEILSCRKVPCKSKTPGRVEKLSPLIVAAKWGGIELIKVRLDSEELDGTLFAKRAGLEIGSLL